MNTDLIVEQYQAVSGSEPLVLNREVQKLISDGWQPWGSVSITNYENRVMYAQAMVKYKKPGTGKGTVSV